MKRAFYALKDRTTDEVLFLYIDDSDVRGANLSTLSPCNSPRVYNCIKLNRAQFRTYRAFGIPEYTPAVEALHLASYN